MKASFRLVIFSTILGTFAACAPPASSVTPASTLSAPRRPRPAETRAAEAAPTVAAAISTIAPTASSSGVLTTAPAAASTGSQVPGSCDAIASLVGTYIGGVATTKSLGSPQHLSCEFGNSNASTLIVVNIGAGGTAAAFDVLRTTSAQGGRTVQPISGLGATAFSVSKNNVPAGVSVLTDQGFVYAVISNLPIAQDEALIKQLMSLP
jgi:hypothetical protein